VRYVEVVEEGVELLEFVEFSFDVFVEGEVAETGVVFDEEFSK
jgi:hypothetical protein